MKKLILIRASFNLSPLLHQRLNPDWIKEHLDLFIQYTYPSLLQQNNTQFYYLLEHAVPTSSLIQEYLIPFNLIPYVIPTTTPHITLENLISEYDLLYFVNVGTDLLFTKEFIDKLYHYTPNPHSRIITIPTQYIYNISSTQLTKLNPPTTFSFVFICPRQEYITYFKTYDSFFPFSLNSNFLKMPHESLSDLNTLRVLSDKDSISAGQIITDLDIKNTILSTFIK